MWKLWLLVSWVTGEVALMAGVPILPVDFKGAKQPQICSDTQGKVLVVFGQSNSVFCVSSTNQHHFTSPIKVGTLDRLALGMRRGPRIVTSKDAAIISAISLETGNILTWRSENDGVWQEVGKVNDSPGSAREGLHAMASDQDQRVFVTWLDLRNQKTEIWGALSKDQGKSWGANVRIYQSPDGTVCECCHPSVIFTPQGEIFVMWRNWLNGSRDMYLSSSKDGKRFGAARKLGEGTWPLKGCPMDGGSLAVSPAGRIISVWRRDKDLFWTDSSGEARLGSGAQPVAFSANGHVGFVWQQGASLVVQNDMNSGLSKILTENGRYPSAVGVKKQVWVVWESTSNGVATLVSDVIE